MASVRIVVEEGGGLFGVVPPSVEVTVRRQSAGAALVAALSAVLPQLQAPTRREVAGGGTASGAGTHPAQRLVEAVATAMVDEGVWVRAVEDSRRASGPGLYGSEEEPPPPPDGPDPAEASTADAAGTWTESPAARQRRAVEGLWAADLPLTSPGTRGQQTLGQWQAAFWRDWERRNPGWFVLGGSDAGASPPPPEPEPGAGE